MARYHLYYLRQGMLVGSGDIEAADENEAARLAGVADRTQTVEIWDDHQRLRVVSPSAPR
jgi:hypothetical protein